ncbi:MAG: YeeE/YedE family protein [Phycisphaerales bacterium]|nr:MAG: YeeE/YedE family protein [Phycisphaerales bacterium]
MEWLRMESWSPYAVGIGIGILSWISFVISDKPLGCSTAFARTAGMLERLLRGKKVDEKPYYRKFTPAIDWEWMLVLGVVIGAFISARLSGEFRLEWVPALWQAEVGQTPVTRWIVALLGGVIMGAGARWAGGCTSGHGISGMLQLAVSSWLAATSFFVGGIITAMVIFKVLL